MSGPSKMEVLANARAKLLDVAAAYELRFDELTGEVLVDAAADEAVCRAADAYTQARWAAHTGAGRGTTSKRGPVSSVILPFGRAKGKLLHEASKGDLQWVLSAVSESIDDPAKERFRLKNIELRDAIETELNSR